MWENWSRHLAKNNIYALRRDISLLSTASRRLRDSNLPFVEGWTLSQLASNMSTAKWKCSIQQGLWNCPRTEFSSFHSSTLPLSSAQHSGNTRSLCSFLEDCWISMVLFVPMCPPWASCTLENLSESCSLVSGVQRAGQWGAAVWGRDLASLSYSSPRSVCPAKGLDTGNLSPQACPACSLSLTTLEYPVKAQNSEIGIVSQIFELFLTLKCHGS